MTVRDTSNLVRRDELDAVTSEIRGETPFYGGSVIEAPGHTHASFQQPALIQHMFQVEITATPSESSDGGTTYERGLSISGGFVVFQGKNGVWRVPYDPGKRPTESSGYRFGTVVTPALENNRWLIENLKEDLFDAASVSGKSVSLYVAMYLSKGESIRCFWFECASEADIQQPTDGDTVFVREIARITKDDTFSGIYTIEQVQFGEIALTSPASGATPPTTTIPGRVEYLFPTGSTAASFVQHGQRWNQALGKFEEYDPEGWPITITFCTPHSAEHSS